jgi:hypothetical protein
VIVFSLRNSIAGRLTFDALGREADHGRRPTRTQHVPGLADRVRTADHLERLLDAAARDRQDLTHDVGSAGAREDRVRGPAAASELELLNLGVDRHDHPGAGEARPCDDLKTDAPAPDHAHALADSHAGPVNRSDPRDDAAAEQRGLPQRDRRR